LVWGELEVELGAPSRAQAPSNEDEYTLSRESVLPEPLPTAPTTDVESLQRKLASERMAREYDEWTSAMAPGVFEENR